MEKKITKKEMFNYVYEVIEKSKVDGESKNAMLSFIEHEIELLDRKKSRTTLTEKQKENVALCEVILEVLKDQPNSTVTELIACEPLSGYTNQKISALLRSLKNDGKVVSVTDKKKATRFSAVD